MANLNHWQGIGYLGRDPEMRYTPSGKAVTKVSIGITEHWNGPDGEKKERTEWVWLESWGKLAEIVNQYLYKGSFIYVEGKIKTDKWEDNGETRYSTKIVMSNFQFLDRKSDNGNGNGNGRNVPQEEMQDGPDINSEDDIPF